jgi:hypothetical protein
MNPVLPQVQLRKVSTESQEAPEGHVSDGQFRELLKTMPVDENLREKDLFALIEEEEAEEIVEGAPIVPLPIHSSPEQKKDGVDAPIAAMAAMPANIPLPFFSPFSNTPSTIQSSLSPQIQALFEKMASTMIVMETSGEKETTLVLDSPQFASSVFFGTKITIREFSTAPKAFNVEIVASQLAINTIDPCKNDLLSAFQNSHFNFSIHRFETYLHTEDRPVLHRKENSDGDHQESEGGRQ